MGLLDDAIREHLELKRRSGADPGEIARKEHEALEPVFPVEPGEDEPGVTATLVGEQTDGAPYDAPPVDHSLETQDGADFSDAVQETAELDMQAVLDEQFEQPPAAPPVSPAGTRPVRAGGVPALPEQDSLEWEAPARSDGERAPENIPGQERMTFE